LPCTVVERWTIIGVAVRVASDGPPEIVERCPPSAGIGASDTTDASERLARSLG